MSNGELIDPIAQSDLSYVNYPKGTFTIALENASNGEYRSDSEWIKQAGKSESTIGVNTAEFIKLYNKYGEKVYSPVIVKGEADIIISFEELESARWIPYLKKGGHLITSVQKIDPMPVITGNMTYPENIEDKVKNLGIDIISVDALGLAEQAGTSKASNVVLMGVLSTKMGFDESVWQKALEQCVPPKFLELNKKAFALGVKNA